MNSFQQVEPNFEEANAHPSNIHTLQAELVALAHEIRIWRKANRYPQGSRYPQYARAREIGSKLFFMGSYDAMTDALEIIRQDKNLARLRMPRLLEYYWSGIGDWYP